MKAEELKGHLDGLILAVVVTRAAARLRGDRGAEGSERGQLALPEGTVYPALHRLEADGLLKSEWSTAQRPAPARLQHHQARGKGARRQP